MKELNEENYKRIDHEDGRVEFVPVKEADKYVDFTFAFYITTNPYESRILHIGTGFPKDEWKYKELLVGGGYKAELVEEDGYQRIRIKKI